MKSIAITHRGCERFCAEEIKEIIPGAKNLKQEETAVIFEADAEDVLKFCYMSQSAIHIFELLSSFSFKTEEDIEKEVKKAKIPDYKFGDFNVGCIRIGEHDFSSQEIKEDVSAAIIELTDKRVNLNNAQINFFAYVYNNKCYFGVDLCGFDLSKRQYRIFTHRDAIKATVAYCMIRASGYTGKETLLDPFCGGGTFAAEAALYASKFSVNYYNKDKFAFRKLNLLGDYGKEHGSYRDCTEFFAAIDKYADKDKKLKIISYDSQFGYVSSAQKNAKIAGINKLIDFGKVEIKWLDTKYEKEAIDIIVSYPPFAKKDNQKVIEKVYKEFFYQAEFILSKKGRIVLASQSPDLLKKYAKEYKFKLLDEFSVWQGRMELVVLVFGK